jgi:hypothetical protein
LCQIDEEKLLIARLESVFREQHFVKAS